MSAVEFTMGIHSAKKPLFFPKNLKKPIDNHLVMCYNAHRAQQVEHRNNNCWCGSMAEQLICNQQVVGSTPITSSRGNSRVAKGGRL